ncbi:osmotically inducible protein OsmC [Mucilaginibacter polytrichastri]|nr:osmotically inducible protein OsmC [Mucilaginibacter polytrichastri]
MIASGSATWQGKWKTGSGTISTKSGAVKGKPYTFSSRFEGTAGGSPEELLAAAHSACYNQALANVLDHAGLELKSVDSRIDIVLGYNDAGHPQIKGAILVVTAKIPGANYDQFLLLAEKAKKVCTISQILTLEPVLQAYLVT